jgi:hypothetical protein
MNFEQSAHQQEFKGEGFDLSEETILNAKEVVTDFFGDNREWYKKLLAGGATFGRVPLDSHEDFEGENDEDFPPLDPQRITEGRAKNIARFFIEYPEAFQDFLQYQRGANSSKEQE